VFGLALGPFVMSVLLHWYFQVTTRTGEPAASIASTHFACARRCWQPGARLPTPRRQTLISSILSNPGMRFRVAIVTAVYRKALVLSQSARQARSTGEIVNLMVRGLFERCLRLPAAFLSR
jgi:hypothetical protein